MPTQRDWSPAERDVIASLETARPLPTAPRSQQSRRRSPTPRDAHAPRARASPAARGARGADPAARGADPAASLAVRLPEVIALVAILLLASGLTFYALPSSGWGNTYYATAVKSMLLNGHNFFFVAFDPGGFLSVDKPPLGLWLQAASAALFGFESLSLKLPSALAGLLSVATLYALLRRPFGPLAALLAALALALAPLSLVANRDNTLDSLLALTSLLAAGAGLRAATSGRLGWLLLAAALVGIGFNIKMLEAFLVLPALGVAYALGALGARKSWRTSWRVHALHLTLAALTLASVSLCWVLAVDLTPRAQRPYIDSTRTDSELDLAFGYNGVARLAGIAVHNPADGDPGPLRLVQPPLGGQVSWFLPFALLGLLLGLRAGLRGLRAPRPAARLAARRRLPRHAQADDPDEADDLAAEAADGDLEAEGEEAGAHVPARDRSDRASYVRCHRAFWSVWLLVGGAFFSAASFFSAYYLTVLVPAICALVGIGSVAVWRSYRASGWRGALLPMALLATAVQQAVILGAHPAWHPWLVPAILLAASALALLLAAPRLVWLATGSHLVAAFGGSLRPLAPLILLGVGAPICLAPLLWLGASYRPANSGSHPLSGPAEPYQGDARAPSAEPKLVRFLLDHAGSARFLVATLTTDAATPIIFDTGRPVMALGGFGGYPWLTRAQLGARVRAGDVRFFLLPSANLAPAQAQELYPPAASGAPAGAPPPAFHHAYTDGLTYAIATACSPVAPGEWSPHVADGPGPLQLYDCAAAAQVAPL